MRDKPCMLCGEPLVNDECRTPDCAYNPATEMEVHEAEWKYDENLHQDVDLSDVEELPDMGGEPDEFANIDTSELEGDFQDEAPPYDPDAEQKDAADDADTLDISQEQMPEPKDDEPLFGDSEKEDEKNEIDSDDRAPDEIEPEKELTKEDKGEDPSDDAHDLPEDDGKFEEDMQKGDAEGEDDPDLPPRPHGCNGDCQPGELGEDGDPCPHCTAKSFKEEMEQQGKEHQSPEQMEQDWNDFLDNWMEQAPEQGQGQGDQGDEQFDKQPEMDGEQKMEDRTPPDLLDEDDGDLPPRPQGCNGDCQPMDQFDPDADPCPHCTAKQFKEQMRHDNDDESLKELTPDEIGDMFQNFLQNWQNQQEKAKDDEPEDEPEQNPEEINEAPPEDEMQDGMPKEKKPKKEREDDSDEFHRVGKDLTITQERRFDNIADRLTKKVEQTFGKTAEDIFLMAKTEGQFAGEEISQSIQITSRGVTYWITLSAAKEI